MIIKILLLLGLTGVALYAFRLTSAAAHLAVRRLAAGMLLLLGAASVLFPSITTWAAARVGIGRGSDLVFYALTVVSLFIWASVYSRLRDLEERYARLVRHLALTESRDEAKFSTQPTHVDP